MAKKVFISFKYGEQPWQDNLLQFFQAWGGKAQATPVYVPESVALGASDNAIKQAIADRMRDCKGLLVVIGNKAQASPWISHELQVASSWRLPYAGTRHPEASGPLPQGFPNMTMLNWSTDDIAKWIAAL
jgi:hypothetical protein